MLIFREIDADVPCFVTLEELEQFLMDPKLHMYLESMDTQPDDLRTLFRALDKDVSGLVINEEFCQVCFWLKGGALRCPLAARVRYRERSNLFLRHFGCTPRRREQPFPGATLGVRQEHVIDAGHDDLARGRATKTVPSSRRRA